MRMTLLPPIMPPTPTERAKSADREALTHKLEEAVRSAFLPEL